MKTKINLIGLDRDILNLIETKRAQTMPLIMRDLKLNNEISWCEVFDRIVFLHKNGLLDYDETSKNVDFRVTKKAHIKYGDYWRPCGSLKKYQDAND